MNININLDSLQQHCRICLQKGDINIWDLKVNLKTAPDIADNLPLEENESSEKSILDLLNIFNNSQVKLYTLKM